MPSLITKRGKKRYRGTVMVLGIRDDKLFPDASKKSLRAALDWEEKREAELRQTTATDTDCLTVESWSNEYLDDVKDRCTIEVYREKQVVFDSFIQFAGFGIHQHAVPLAESSPAAILTAEANGVSFRQKGGEGKRFRSGPVDSVSPFNRLETSLEQPLQLCIDSKAIRQSDQFFGKRQEGFILYAGIDRFVGIIAVKFMPVIIKMNCGERAFTAVYGFISIG